jgi:hypothetical protein
MRRLLTFLTLLILLAPLLSCQGRNEIATAAGSNAATTDPPQEAAPAPETTPTAGVTPTAETAPAPDAASTGDDVTPAGSALSTIFSLTRAPKQKTMGLLQRSFLDLADQGDQELELAIVVDGTDSMATELAGVRRSIHQMLEDLRLYRNNEVRAAIVVYRDAGSKSGEVTIPLGQFTSDKATIEKAVEALQPESGEPFFHELPDLGLHRALTELPWSDDDQVAKWILLFGDAPPYPESFDDASTPQARRRIATAILISLAKRRNIRINCILCTSSDNVSEAYDGALAETRGFMSALSSGTDGLMLDLSYEAIRTAMIDASKQPDVGMTAIQPISSIDLAAVRRDDAGPADNVKPVSLAVIPHLPIQQIDFDVRNPAVQVATALRTKLEQVPGVRVASPRKIKEQLRRLGSEPLTDEQAIRGLAARLSVDFVVWGQLLPAATVQTAAYRRSDGQQIVPVKLARNSSDMAYALIQASAQSAPGDPALSQLFSNMQQLQDQLNQPIGNSEATTDSLLAAMEALEQSLAFEAGSEESVQLLETADRESKNAVQAESKNPVAHWLQANVAYNQAARLYRTSQIEAARKRAADVRRSLGEAIKFRKSLQNESLVIEIEADFHLHEGRPEESVQRYLKLTEPNRPQQSQLRGHWMLAGIYAGDWGNTSKPIVNPDEARRHVIEILANWSESPEASLLKEWLRWDETKERTEFNYLPQLNTGLL